MTQKKDLNHESLWEDKMKQTMGSLFWHSLSQRSVAENSFFVIETVFISKSKTWMVIFK